MQSNRMTATSDFFSYLPDDLLKLILSFSERQAVGRLAKTSPRWHEIVEGSFRGRSARFGSLLIKDVNNLIKEVKEFAHQSKENLIQQFESQLEKDNRRNDIYWLVTKVIFFAVCARLLQNYLEDPSYNNTLLLGLGIAMAAIMVALKALSTSEDNRIDQVLLRRYSQIGYLAELVSSESKTHSLLTAILEKYSHLFDAVESIEELASVRLESILDYLRTNATEIDYVSKVLNNYIESKRFQLSPYLDMNEFLMFIQQSIPEKALNEKTSEQKHRLVFVSEPTQINSTLNDAIVIYKFDDRSFCVVQVGGSKRLLKLNLTDQEKASLPSQVFQATEVNDPPLVAKIVEQCATTVVAFANNVGTFWQQNQTSRFKASAVTNRIVEVQDEWVIDINDDERTLESKKTR